MREVVSELFPDSKAAGNAVTDLKDAGFIDEVSIIAKNPETTEARFHHLKGTAGKGALGGALIGMLIGALPGFLLAMSVINFQENDSFFPVGLLVIGGGIVGAIVGILVGGFVAGLVAQGLPQHGATEHRQSVNKGEIQVSVATDEEKIQKVKDILQKHKEKMIKENPEKSNQ